MTIEDQCRRRVWACVDCLTYLASCVEQVDNCLFVRLSHRHLCYGQRKGQNNSFIIANDTRTRIHSDVIKKNSSIKSAVTTGYPVVNAPSVTRPSSRALCLPRTLSHPDTHISRAARDTPRVVPSHVKVTAPHEIRLDGVRGPHTTTDV